jgi:nucleoside-diphosphate-sugar epimerase
MLKKLLFTGASGFLGNNTLSILEKSYEVCTVGLTDEDNIKTNLAIEVPSIDKHFDVVLHAAGKAHSVPKTNEEKQLFYAVNFQGTVNLCKALERVGVPKSFVFISTVAVYGCESGDLITEEHPLDGTTPYAESKKKAEEFLIKWCNDNSVVLGILRPSLLAGRNAPGNLGAMVRGIEKGFYFNIDGGKGRKSILMAEDIAHLLPLIADKGGIYNVCDDYNPTFGEISKSIAKQLGKRNPLNIPYKAAWCFAKIGDKMGSIAPINTYRLTKMTESLTFSNEKAKRELGWKPLDVLANYTL